MISSFHVAPSPDPQGMQAAGTALKYLDPLAPFGLSVVFIAGTPSLGIGVVCHKSDPGIQHR